LEQRKPCLTRTRELGLVFRCHLYDHGPRIFPYAPLYLES
jgi:hypothetical protein